MKSVIGTALLAGLALATAALATAQDEPIPASQRVEIPAAGVALSLPDDWAVETMMEVGTFHLPAGHDVESVSEWHVLQASSPGSHICGLSLYEEASLGLSEHAHLLAERRAESDEASFTVGPVTLPVGEAEHIVVDDPGRVVFLEAYLFDAGGRRYEFHCFDEFERDTDLWRALAQTIELLAADVSGYDPFADATSIEMFSDFTSVVEVGDGRRMNADCASGMWAEFEDGTFREAIACELSDRPLDDPQLQGSRPTETVRVSGGACEWASDYWLSTDGSEVWATSWELTVTPDGAASGASTYGADMLDCEGG